MDECRYDIASFTLSSLHITQTPTKYNFESSFTYFANSRTRTLQETLLEINIERFPVTLGKMNIFKTNPDYSPGNIAVIRPGVGGEMEMANQHGFLFFLFFLHSIILLCFISLLILGSIVHIYDINLYHQTMF
jgi:hypothetical protein